MLECNRMCEDYKNSECKFWTYIPKRRICLLLSSCVKKELEGVVSGEKGCNGKEKVKEGTCKYCPPKLPYCHGVCVTSGPKLYCDGACKASANASSTKNYKDKIGYIHDNVIRLLDQVGVQGSGCSWTCPVKLAAEALVCAGEHDPETDPVGFVQCLIKAARSSGCLACVCDFICDHYSSACSACRSSTDSDLALFAARPTFTIKNTLEETVTVDVKFQSSQCNYLGRKLDNFETLSVPYDGCGSPVHVTAATVVATATPPIPSVVCSPAKRIPPFANLEVISTSTPKSPTKTCVVENA